MDSEDKLLLERAENEILIAETLNRLSNDSSAKETLSVPIDSTFYSSVIGHAYYAIYAIFYVSRIHPLYLT